MVRAAILACTFVLCLSGILAADPVYEARVLHANLDGSDPNNGILGVHYKIKRPASDKILKNSPVFYGIGGAEDVDSMIKNYKLFDKQFLELDDKGKTITPTIVYVEQRFIGNSGPQGEFTKFADYNNWNIENVIADHVKLIKELSTELGTTKFMVFGFGQGGLLAGYVANRFATDADLLKAYTVLGWASSPPVKYIADDTSFSTAADFSELSEQLKALMKVHDGCKTDPDIAKFKRLFDGIKKWTTADDLAALRMNPPPTLQATADTPTHSQKEFAIFLRNAIIGLAFDNNPYNDDGTARDTRLKKFCTALGTVTFPADPATHITAANVNPLLVVLGGLDPAGADKIENWQLKQTNSILYNKPYAFDYYQSCTYFRLAFCATDAATDPLAGSAWETTLPCGNKDQYKAVIKAECEGLFEETIDMDAHTNTQPKSFTKRVITTIDRESFFGKSASRFSSDAESAADFSKNIALWGRGSWEFQAPRDCDNNRAKNVRYLALRVFGCLAGFVDPNTDKKQCDAANLFKGGDDADPDVTAPTCPLTAATVAESKFPFGRDPVTIINTGLPQPPVITQPTQPGQPGQPGTSPATPESNTNGASSMFSVACVLFSSLLMFAAGTML